MPRTFTEDEVRELIEAAVAPLRARIAELEAEVARLKKDSSTSSKPPSSDIVKPPRPPAAGGRRGKRRRGGQFGHRQHLRPSFPPDQVDHFPPIFEWTGEPLGPEWIATDEFRTIQQVELAEKLVEVTEYRARLYRSFATGEVIAAPFPEEVLRAGLIGPRLSALIAYQKGACHMSYTSIEKFFGDVLRLDISRGQLAKVIQKGSAALGACYTELQAVLPEQPTLNVDETDAVMQFCWAHLVRDVKFLTTLSDPVTARFGAKLLAAIKVLFRAWHRRSAKPSERWKRDAERAKQAVLKIVRRAPSRSEAQNIAERFRDYGEYYFTFLKMPGVEPTNNAMERGFRHLVIDRKVTQGTRGEPGRRWCERIWTVLATCAQQGRSAFQFIHQSIMAYFNDHSFPSLLPQGP